MAPHCVLLAETDLVEIEFAAARFSHHHVCFATGYNDAPSGDQRDEHDGAHACVTLALCRAAIVRQLVVEIGPTD
jgi:hypothetical protein